ncbi:MAG: DMT family transporter [Acidobacteria bacterium]|nr:DMT family transporter [Acidobacteriota bacterium]
MPKWLVYSMASMLIWAIWSLVSPIASRELSGSMIQVLSSVGLIPFAFLLLFSKHLKEGTHFGKGLLLAMATGIMAGTGNILLYNALANHGPVSLVFPITSMAPLVPVLAAPFLFREKIRGIQALGVALALIAIVLLNTTSSPAGAAGPVRLFSAWMLYALLALLVFGATFLTQKGATYFISDELSTVAYAVAFVLLDVVLLATDQSLMWNIPATAGWVSVFIGVLMGGGSLTLFAAYRHGKASVVTPLSQLFPIITVLVAVPLYGERIDLLKGIGIAAALAAGLILGMERTESNPITGTGREYT